MAKKSSTNGKSHKKAAKASAVPSSSAASEPFEYHVRERAYSIWIAEGRPHGRDLAHWQRAHQELQREAP